MDNLKMYILVRESIPLGIGMVSVAHASLACYLKYKDNPMMQKWLSESFRKVTCKVSDKQFEMAKKCGLEHVLISENKYNDEEIALAFVPRSDWPKMFMYLQLYR